MRGVRAMHFFVLFYCVPGKMNLFRTVLCRRHWWEVQINDPGLKLGRAHARGLGRTTQRRCLDRCRVWQEFTNDDCVLHAVCSLVQTQQTHVSGSSTQPTPLVKNSGLRNNSEAPIWNSVQGSKSLFMAWLSPFF